MATTTTNRGLRYNQGKAELSLVLEAGAALKGAADVLTHGKAKYSRGNWKKGLPVTEIIDSLLRHLTSYLDQDQSDVDDGEKGSGLPHVDHVLVNALFLATMARRAECDDRSPPEAPKRATPKSTQPRKRRKA